MLGDSEDNFVDLIRQIKSTPITIDSFDSLQDKNDALSAILLNRWSFSGIRGAGPIGGRSQTGAYKIGCRFNPGTLSKLLQDIRREYQGVVVTNLDFRDIECLPRDVVYLDPPYVLKGGQLYPCSMSERDHRDLSEWVKALPCYWALSYDDCELIRDLYANYHIQDVTATYTISGRNRKNIKRTEILITCNNA